MLRRGRRTKSPEPQTFAIVTDARRREEAFTVYGRGEFPVKIEGPSLKAAGTDVAIESVDLAGERVADTPRIEVRTISGAILARVAAHLLPEGMRWTSTRTPLPARPRCDHAAWTEAGGA